MTRPPDEITLRAAVPADVMALAGLLSLLFAQEADFKPDFGKQERALRMILEQAETGRIFCAAHPEAGIVGMVSILFTVSTAEGGRAAWLEDMIVRPDWRGRGIGEMLLCEAIRGAREAGCLRVTLLTDDENQTAMRFYGRQDFERSAMVPMRRSL